MFFHFFRSNRPVVQVFPACVAIKYIAALCLAGAVNALADEGRSRAPVLPLYQQECAACHIAYTAGMLPAPSWQRLMGGLQKHFGTDASLDEASVRKLSEWLQANAGNSRKVREAPAQDRISRADWFVRQHHEVDNRIWTQPAVKSAANCGATPA